MNVETLKYVTERRIKDCGAGNLRFHSLLDFIERIL